MIRRHFRTALLESENPKAFDMAKEKENIKRTKVMNQHIANNSPAET
jgi:hypothetical protein